MHYMDYMETFWRDIYDHLNDATYLDRDLAFWLAVTARAWTLFRKTLPKDNFAHLD